jgi:hypothetical protein
MDRPRRGFPSGEHPCCLFAPVEYTTVTVLLT